MSKPRFAFVMAVAVMAGAAAVQAGTLPQGPSAGDQDLSPFYRWSAALPRSPGVLLRQEPMPTNLVPAHAALAVRILYTSTDGRWNSGILPVSGALYLPKGTAPAGGWPLVVWAHGTLGVADSCAPSWAGANERDRAYVDRWLAAGFAVAAPDYQGLGGPGPHPYTNWKAEGQSTLDSAKTAFSMGLPLANQVVITGQSQGSGASLGAARLAAGYAPQLKVKGAIATAVLTAFPEAKGEPVLPSPESAPHFRVYRMIGGGMPDGSPAAETFLTAKGRVLLESARVGCAPRVVAEREGITLDNAFTESHEAFDKRMGNVGAQTPFKVKFPLMLGTGLADEAIAPERQRRAVLALCKSGNTVVWKRYPKANHGGTLTESFDDAERFARSLLSGGTMTSECKALQAE